MIRIGVVGVYKGSHRKGKRQKRRNQSTRCSRKVDDDYNRWVCSKGVSRIIGEGTEGEKAEEKKSINKRLGKVDDEKNRLETNRS